MTVWLRQVWEYRDVAIGETKPGADDSATKVVNVTRKRPAAVPDPEPAAPAGPGPANAAAAVAQGGPAAAAGPDTELSSPRNLLWVNG